MQNKNFIFLLLGIFLLAAFVLQLTVGSVFVSANELLRLFTGNSNNEIFTNIVFGSRLPSAIAALVSGAALAVSGLMMQTMFRNPVAGPYVLGISSGAMLGVALLVLGAGAMGIREIYGIGAMALVFAAATGALTVFLFTFFVSLYMRSVVAMLIIGLMIGGAISAVVEVLQSLSGSDALKSYLMWTFGSFRYVNNSQVLYLSVIVCAALIGAFFLCKSLNLLLLGDVYAESSGLSIRKTKIQIIILTSLLAGTVTSFCGPIGFVGLAVPHIARKIFGTANHQTLVPACMLIGAIVCGVANVVAVLPGSDKILPLNAIMNILSAPVVIWIILQQRKQQSW